MRTDELLNRLEQGDAEALDELIRMYYPEILRYCLWHTSDRQSAEDAAQETFLKAYRAPTPAPTSGAAESVLSLWARKFTSRPAMNAPSSRRI